MMKRSCFQIILGVTLFCLVLLLNGCRYPVKAADFVGGAVYKVAMLGSGEEFSQPGQTEAELHRKYLRYRHISRQQMLEDIDRALLTDRPSSLTDKRIY